MRRDLKSAMRLFRREPGFAATVVLSLAIGIGANTAIFSVVDGVLLRELPYREPGRLVAVNEVIPKFSHLYPRLPVNLNHLVEWRKRVTALEGVAAAQGLSLSLTGSGPPELLNAARVSANLFGVLGVAPRLGRTFLEEEDPAGRDGVVILTDTLWKRRYNADPGVIGRKIVLDGSPFEIVGVLPPWFRFPEQGGTGGRLLGERTEIFKPLGYRKEDLEAKVGDFNYAGFARLRPGIAAGTALAELNVAQAAISRTLEEKLDLRTELRPLREQVVGPVRRGLLVVMAAVGAVLLVLCVNLANLSLARAAGRAREAAIRAALGASRGQLVRQGLVESTLLALAGGVLGMLVAYWGVKILVGTAPVNLPRLVEVGVDGRVLGFALLMSLATGIAFGILPAWRAARTEPQDALKAGSHTTTEGARGVRLRDALVGLEVALSVVLVATAGLLMNSFVRLMKVDRGFDVERVITMNVTLPSARYTGTGRISRFFDRVLEKVQTVPGVESAAVVSLLPLLGEGWVDVASTESDPRPFLERPKVNVRFVSPDYFKTLRIGLAGGRTFDDRDRERKVAIVSRALADELWPGRDPVGRRMLHNERPVEVTGVTPDIRSTTLDKKPVLMLYVPYWQRPRLTASLVVRTAMEPRGVAAAVRGAVWEVDPEAPLTEMKTMEQVLAQSVAQRKFQMTLVGIFAAAALALAGLGTYGVVSYTVTRRRTEMGIRLALGASPAAVRRMVLRQGLAPVFIGLAAGIAAALAAGRVFESLLFEVSARDPLTLAAVSLVLLAVAAAACVIPARRATRVDPVRALRFE
jgi:putative ABC transport system permease protein